MSQNKGGYYGTLTLEQKFHGHLTQTTMKDTDYKDKNVYWFAFSGGQCPICGHHDWCMVNVTGTKVICMRSDDEKAPQVANGRLFHLNSDAVEFTGTEQQEFDNTINFADPKVMDTVNRLVLATHKLSEKHHGDLLHRGLTEEEIILHGSRGFGSFSLRGFPDLKAQRSDGYVKMCSTWERLFQRLQLPKDAWKGVPGFYQKHVDLQEQRFMDKTTGETVIQKAAILDYPVFESPTEGMLIPYYNEKNQVVGFQVRVDHQSIVAKDVENSPKLDKGTKRTIIINSTTREYKIEQSYYGRDQRVVGQGTIKNEKPIVASINGVSKCTFTPHFGGKYFWVSSAKKYLGANGKMPLQVAYNPTVAQLKPNDEKLKQYIKQPKQIWLTEGGLKALVATAKLSSNYILPKGMGTDFLAVAGVSSYRKFLPMLKKLNATSVVVAFDMDFQANVQVSQNLKKLVNELHEQGYKVQVAYWLNKKGIDDALVAGEKIKLRNLFDEEEKRKMQEVKAKGLPATSVLPTLLPKKH